MSPPSQNPVSIPDNIILQDQISQSGGPYYAWQITVPVPMNQPRGHGKLHTGPVPHESCIELRMRMTMTMTIGFKVQIWQC